MTPKEKAKEITLKYYKLGEHLYMPMSFAKDSALIAVDEVKWFHERLFYLTEGSIFDKYLNDVKLEIKKL